jgi:PTH2 family peptidyl-tRNA hydrolase
MSSGKSAAQACHAARLSLLKFLKINPERAVEFIELNSCGSMVVLDAPDLQTLHKMAAKAVSHRLPWALFVDSGHIHPPAFDGSPVVTALAIGPALKEQIRPITRHLRCLGDPAHVG